MPMVAPLLESVIEYCILNSEFKKAHFYKSHRIRSPAPMSHLLTIADAVATHARLNPNKIGVRDSSRALSFAEWDRRATALAAGLLALGLRKGDRVGLLAYNCIEWME